MFCPSQIKNYIITRLVSNFFFMHLVTGWHLLCRKEFTIRDEFILFIKLAHTTWAKSEARWQSWLIGYNDQLCIYVCVYVCLYNVLQVFLCYAICFQLHCKISVMFSAIHAVAPNCLWLYEPQHTLYITMSFVMQYSKARK